MLMINLVLCILYFSTLSTKAIARAIEISSSNFTANLAQWDVDLAIMFYAPWCKYCKELSSSFDQIADLVKDSQSIVIGKLNCELHSDNSNLCLKLKIDRYPSIYFLGYGNLNPGASTNMHSIANPRIVEYMADLYPDAIYDWIRMLHNMGWIYQKWDSLRAIFSGKSLMQSRISSLVHENEVLRDKNQLYSNELDRLKTLELIKKLPDLGDPFPLVNSLEPEEVVFTVSLVFLSN